MYAGQYVWHSVNIKSMSWSRSQIDAKWTSHWQTNKSNWHQKFDVHRLFRDASPLRSVYDIKVPCECLEIIQLLMVLNRSCGTFISYADRSTQCRCIWNKPFDSLNQSFIQDNCSKIHIKVILCVHLMISDEEISNLTWVMGIQTTIRLWKKHNLLYFSLVEIISNKRANMVTHLIG